MSKKNATPATDLPSVPPQWHQELIEALAEDGGDATATAIVAACLHVPQRWLDREVDAAIDAKDEGKRLDREVRRLFLADDRDLSAARSLTA